jgi:hypothetical protein
MTRQEIINLHQQDENIQFEYSTLKPYLKSLAIYFASYSSKYTTAKDMILAIYSITNNSCYGRIVCPEEFSEILSIEEDEESELINFQSKFIFDLI